MTLHTFSVFFNFIFRIRAISEEVTIFFSNWDNILIKAIKTQHRVFVENLKIMPASKIL